ncbi:MAG TPA: GNAT family N-acetyltransferase [Candidatus Saccharimonadales bacterium]|nr:GNAT family N-acetyltransferase [Candidatus Saccharimonadales bacterium]
MSKDVPIITDATTDDVEAIIAMHAQSWRDTYPNENAGVSHEWVENRVQTWSNPEKLAKRTEKIKQASHDPDLLYRVAKDSEGRIIGMIMPHRDETTQRVGAIYVDKAYYGTGLAQRLMSEILDWADPTRPLELEVATYNERAKAFYRKYGFKEVEGSEYNYDVIPVVKMIRKGDRQ